MSFRIVIAEDDPVARRDLREMLAEMGHEVVGEARSGRQALNVVADCRPDIVLLDVVMPELDGLQVAQEIAPDYPVIMVTTHSTGDFVQRAQAAGVLAYLSKPYRQQDLGPAIELVISTFIRQSQLGERIQALSGQLDARKLVERAKGLLMDKDSLSEGEAYRSLQQLSMKQNVSLKQVAEAVIAALS